jgi:hypothetical protein
MSRLSLLQIGYDILALSVEELGLAVREPWPRSPWSAHSSSGWHKRPAEAAQHRELTLELTWQCKLNIPWDQPAWSLSVKDKVEPVSHGVRLALNGIKAWGLAPAICHLRVRSDPYDDAEMESEKPTFHGVLASLSLMTGLTDLTWTSRTRLPNEVTELLQSRPALRLHNEFPGRHFTILKMGGSRGQDMKKQYQA